MVNGDDRLFLVPVHPGYPALKGSKTVVLIVINIVYCLFLAQATFPTLGMTFAFQLN